MSNCRRRRLRPAPTASRMAISRERAAARPSRMVARFAQAMREHAARKLKLDQLVPFLQVEAELQLEDLDWRLVETLKLFEPFGEKNPKPIFASYDLTVISASMVGALQNHIRCQLRSGTGKTQKFIGFYRSDLAGIITPGASVDALYEVGGSEWNGTHEIQCKIIDARGSI